MTEMESMFFSLRNQYYRPFLAPDQNSCIFYTLKDGFFTCTLEQWAGSAESVGEKVATSWDIADLFLSVQKPLSLHGTFLHGNHSPIYKAQNCYLFTKIYLLETVEGVLRRKKMHLLTAGFEQNVNEYQCPEQCAAIGFLQALNKKPNCQGWCLLGQAAFSMSLCRADYLSARSKVRVPPTEPRHSFPQNGEFAVEISLWSTNPSTPTLVIYEV